MKAQLWVASRVRLYFYLMFIFLFMGQIITQRFSVFYVRSLRENEAELQNMGEHDIVGTQPWHVPLIALIWPCLLKHP